VYSLQNLQNARLELCLGGDTVLSRQTRDDHRLHGGAVVNDLVGRLKLSLTLDEATAASLKLRRGPNGAPEKGQCDST